MSIDYCSNDLLRCIIADTAIYSFGFLLSICRLTISLMTDTNASLAVGNSCRYSVNTLIESEFISEYLNVQTRTGQAKIEEL